MAEKLTQAKLLQQAMVYATPPVASINAPVDRTFGLPPRIYGAIVGLYLGFLALMAGSFAHPQLMLPMAIFVLVISAAFGLPTIWTRMAPESRVKAMTWQHFQRNGIQTGSGHLTARDATAQVLMLPILILVWGVAVTTIAAIVA